MPEPIYAEPIPNTFEGFFDDKILEALKKFISENTTSVTYTLATSPIDYINAFFEHIKNLNGYNDTAKKNFYKSLATSLENYKKPDSSKLDLLIGLLKNTESRTFENFTELYNMLQQGPVYVYDNGNPQPNPVYAQRSLYGDLLEQTTGNGYEQPVYEEPVPPNEEPEIVGPRSYDGFWGDNDLSLGEEGGNY